MILYRYHSRMGFFRVVSDSTWAPNTWAQQSSPYLQEMSKNKLKSCSIIILPVFFLPLHTLCRLIYLMESKGIDTRELSLQRGLFGAEPWSESIRNKIEKSLGINAYDIYGISELMGPGVAGECEFKDGLHYWEDHFIAEIINPETGEILCDGCEGELVFTTLTRESMPLIRYRTGRYNIHKFRTMQMRKNPCEARADKIEKNRFSDCSRCKHISVRCG